VPAPDVVVLAVKTTGLAAAVRAVAPLLGPGVAVVPAVNGMPWWFLDSAGALDVLAGRSLRSLDPSGDLAALVPASRVVGAVVHLAASVPEPGVVEHPSGNRLIIGDAGGGLAERVSDIEKALTAGGLVVDVCATPAALREQVWIKLLGNMSFNPISALTGGTLAGIARDPAVARLCTDMIRECLDVGAALGVHADISPAARVAMAVELGEVKTSMLQDAEAGRELELDSMPGVVSELGELLGIETRATDAVLGLLRMRERVRRGG
jgi:2-dehydropantoate 2-reductase